MIVRGASRRWRQLPGRDSSDPFEEVATQGFSMRVVRVEAGRRSPHRHPHSQEAIFVVDGRGVLWEDGVTRPFEAGDCALIQIGVAHATIPDAGTAMELVCFFPHADLEHNLEELGDVVIGERAEEGEGSDD